MEVVIGLLDTGEEISFTLGAVLTAFLEEKQAMSNEDQPNAVDETKPALCTTDQQPFDPTTDANGQQKNYIVLCDEERAKGFVRPVRRTYIHDKCGVATTMGQALAETYARDPKFYGSTFCVACKGHFPVGENGEFKWEDGTRVGS